MKRIALGILMVAVLALAGAAGWSARARAAGPVAPTGPRLDTLYQAVLLTNGQVYYGKLEGLGSAYPVLNDVYYVQVGVDTGTKQTKSVLLKRGNEWHAPDRMVLNANHILLVEPVTPGSRVARLIAEMPK